MSVRNPKSIRRLCRDLLPLLHRAVRGRRIRDSVEAVVATDRWNSFDRFHDTTRTIAAQYEAGGAKMEVESISTGGRIGTGRWVIHEASDFRSASVEVVSPVRRRLIDCGNNPFHGVMWGVATPPGGTRCELVVLDDPRQLDRLPAGGLTGKAVLTSLCPKDHLGKLGKLAAPCVISDRPVPEHRSALSWTRFGWGGIPIETGPVRLTGFAISRQQGEALRGLHAKRGPLMLRIKADIRRYAGTHDVVSGVIPGRDDPQDEVWALAHTCEPGAMDNASGVATCIEIARVMEGLIAAGRLPRPRRSIRLLHGFECYGFFAYMENLKRFQTPLAGVVIDTVGARPSVCGGRLGWHATIPMSAGFVNRIGEAALRAALRIQNPGYRFYNGPFISTSDTLVGDPKYGFPCPWLTTYFRGPNRPYDAYHSSADTIGLLSASGLKLGASAMAAYLYYLADAGSEEVMELATVETNRVERKARDTSGSQAQYLREQHQVSIDRLKRWLWGGDRREILSHLAACEKRIARACGRVAAPRSGGGAGGLCAPADGNSVAHAREHARSHRRPHPPVEDRSLGPVLGGWPALPSRHCPGHLLRARQACVGGTGRDFLRSPRRTRLCGVDPPRSDA